MSFEIQNCPMCHRHLSRELLYQGVKYFCPHKYHYYIRSNSNFERYLSHYSVIIQSSFLDKQEIVAYPYHIDITDTILVYKYLDQGMKYLFRLNKFKIDSEDKIVKRLDNLVLFS